MTHLYVFPRQGLDLFQLIEKLKFSLKFDSNYWTGCRYSVSCLGILRNFASYIGIVQQMSVFRRQGSKIEAKNAVRTTTTGFGVNQIPGKNELFLKNMCYFRGIRGNSGVRQ
jgi:hypothetical protein